MYRFTWPVYAVPCRPIRQRRTCRISCTTCRSARTLLVGYRPRWGKVICPILNMYVCDQRTHALYDWCDTNIWYIHTHDIIWWNVSLACHTDTLEYRIPMIVWYVDGTRYQPHHTTHQNRCTNTRRPDVMFFYLSQRGGGGGDCLCRSNGCIVSLLLYYCCTAAVINTFNEVQYIYALFFILFLESLSDVRAL